MYKFDNLNNYTNDLYHRARQVRNVILTGSVFGEEDRFLRFFSCPSAPSTGFSWVFAPALETAPPPMRLRFVIFCKLWTMHFLSFSTTLQLSYGDDGTNSICSPWTHALRSFNKRGTMRDGAQKISPQNDSGFLLQYVYIHEVIGERNISPLSRKWSTNWGRRTWGPGDRRLVRLWQTCQVQTAEQEIVRGLLRRGEKFILMITGEDNVKVVKNMTGEPKHELFSRSWTNAMIFNIAKL